MALGSGKWIMIMVLFILIIFCIGNLIYNVERLEIGEEIIPEYEGEPEAESYLASSSSTAQTINYMVKGLLWVSIAITIGSIIYGIGTKDRTLRKSIVHLIIGGGLAMIFFASVFSFAQLETSDYMQNEVLDTGYTTGNDTANGTISTSSDKPDGMDITISIMFAGGAIAVLVLIVYSIAQLTHLRNETFSNIDLDAMTEGVGQTIQRAIDDMTTGTDVRSSIMRCYADMCKLAARHGISDEEHLTPREFETLIGSKLPVADDKLHELILVFEEARYSDHELSEIMKERALGALGRIRDDLVIECESEAIAFNSSNEVRGAEPVEDCEVAGNNGSDEGRDKAIDITAISEERTSTAGGERNEP